MIYAIFQFSVFGGWGFHVINFVFRSPKYCPLKGTEEGIPGCFIESQLKTQSLIYIILKLNEHSLPTSNRALLLLNKVVPFNKNKKNQFNAEIKKKDKKRASRPEKWGGKLIRHYCYSNSPALVLRFNLFSFEVRVGF